MSWRQTLSEIADRLEKAADVKAEAAAIIKDIIVAHKRIVFNGNNYDPAWVEEAAKRGLPNIGNTVLAIEVLKAKKNIAVFEKQGVLSHVETESRYEILLDKYAKTINVEALTLVDIVNRQILPAVLTFAGNLAGVVANLKAAGLPGGAAGTKLATVAKLADSLQGKVEGLTAATASAAAEEEVLAMAKAYREKVVAALESVREDVDALEMIVPANIWPVPVYTDLLFKV